MATQVMRIASFENAAVTIDVTYNDVALTASQVKVTCQKAFSVSFTVSGSTRQHTFPAGTSTWTLSPAIAWTNVNVPTTWSVP